MYKGGPLRKGDILVAVDGNDSFTMSEYLAYLIQKKRPGMKVLLTVLRGGKKQNIPWVLR